MQPGHKSESLGSLYIELSGMIGHAHVERKTGCVRAETAVTFPAFIAPSLDRRLRQC
jgi:hypothetical protein